MSVNNSNSPQHARMIINKIMGIRRKTSLSISSNSLGAEQTITDRTRTRRLRWFGHVMRRPANTLVYKAYHQDFQNPRPRGRPPKRWKDQIQSDTGITLSVAEAIALDRTGWRNLTEGSKGPAPGLGT
ncbi:hypothetical protein Bbelb_023550 [Branchiostoma belcheri]|nr:hypothetical protein Bbelb_023550 [Branchiostoma belcheri]